MQRFAISVNNYELTDLITAIENYELPPVFISRSGKTSYHPWVYDGQTIVIIFNWVWMCPVTVYRESWFSKEEGQWTPRYARKLKAKERRVRDRETQLKAEKSGNLKYEY